MVEVFETKIRKIGNSLGILIPSKVIEEIDAHDGDIVHVAIPKIDIKNRNEKLLNLAGIDKGRKSFIRKKEDKY